MCHDEEMDTPEEGLNQNCRQICIESPVQLIEDFVFRSMVRVPETPLRGVRIKIICAGVCYKRNRSVSESIRQSASALSVYSNVQRNVPAGHYGIRDGAFYSGFEVAGVIESLGAEIASDCELKLGQRVIIFPHDDVQGGYTELMAVSNLKYVIPIPNGLPIAVAAMLPSGALLAMNAICSARKIVKQVLQKRKYCKILIVGTGSLALCTLKIAAYFFAHLKYQDRVKITIASLQAEGFLFARKVRNCSVFQWNEDSDGTRLIERTRDNCDGLADIVIDFGTTSRSLRILLLCLYNEGGIFVSQEVNEKFVPKSLHFTEKERQQILPVPSGSVEQLRELVRLVAAGKIKYPPYTVFPCEKALDVVRKLCMSQIFGCVVLRFNRIT